MGKTINELYNFLDEILSYVPKYFFIVVLINIFSLVLISIIFYLLKRKSIFKYFEDIERECNNKNCKM